MRDAAPMMSDYAAALSETTLMMSAMTPSDARCAAAAERPSMLRRRALYDEPRRSRAAEMMSAAAMRDAELPPR